MRISKKEIEEHIEYMDQMQYDNRTNRIIRQLQEDLKILQDKYDNLEYNYEALKERNEDLKERISIQRNKV